MDQSEVNTYSYLPFDWPDRFGRSNALESGCGAFPEHSIVDRAKSSDLPWRHEAPEQVAKIRFGLVCGGDARLGSPARWYPVGKRLFDIAISLAGLVALSPFLALVALLVRIDSPGPSLFSQQRLGQHGRPFNMLKFRTMRLDSSLLSLPIHKLPGDPRLTRLGRILRATSIDELPQLINVLRGDMSLVGPRPEIVTIALNHYAPWQYQRLLVPQGMTGWWQVTGRGSKLLRSHTEDDLYYIEHASFWFDLKILLLTVRAVFRREGAF